MFKKSSDFNSLKHFHNFRLRSSKDDCHCYCHIMPATINCVLAGVAEKVERMS